MSEPETVQEIAAEIKKWAEKFLRGLPIQSHALGFAARLKRAVRREGVDDE